MEEREDLFLYDLDSFIQGKVVELDRLKDEINELSSERRATLRAKNTAEYLRKQYVDRKAEAQKK
jgi:cell division protein FtsL